MADLMEEQKRYLAARLKECETNPLFNKNQIAEYNKYLGLLASCKDPNEYAEKIASSGNMFSVSQAEQLDRWENLQTIKKLFGDEKSVTAQQGYIDAVKSAASHEDLNSKITEVSTRANEIINNASHTVGLVSSLISELVRYKISADDNKKTRKTAVANAWNELKKFDPDASWEKILSYKPYRSVLIFDEKRLEAFKTLLTEVLN